MEATLDQPNARLRPLVEAACAGDRDAFRMLVEPYVGRALGAATIITRSPADAADAVFVRTPVGGVERWPRTRDEVGCL